MHTFMVNRPSSPPKCTLRSKCGYNSHLFEGFKIQKYQMYTTMNSIFWLFCTLLQTQFEKKTTFWLLGVKYPLHQRSKKSKTLLCYSRNQRENSLFLGGEVNIPQRSKQSKTPLYNRRNQRENALFGCLGGGNCINPKNKKLYQNNFEFTMTKKTLYLTQIL